MELGTPDDISTCILKIQSQVEDLFQSVYAAPLVVQTMAVDWIEEKLNGWKKQYDVHEHTQGSSSKSKDHGLDPSTRRSSVPSRGQNMDKKQIELSSPDILNQSSKSVVKIGRSATNIPEENFEDTESPVADEESEISDEAQNCSISESDIPEKNSVKSEITSENATPIENTGVDRHSKKYKDCDVPELFTTGEGDGKQSKTVVTKGSGGKRKKGKPRKTSQGEVDYVVNVAADATPTRRSGRMRSKKFIDKNEWVVTEEVKFQESLQKKLKLMEPVENSKSTTRRGRHTKELPKSLDCKSEPSEESIGDDPAIKSEPPEDDPSPGNAAEIPKGIANVPRRRGRKPKTKQTSNDISEPSAEKPETNKGKSKSNSDVESRTCSICSRVLSTRGALRLHMSVHSDDRPHQCTECELKFKTNVNLRNHFVAVHGGEKYKKFVCKFCDFRAVTKMQVVMHERHRHTGHKPFLCDSCGFTAVSNTRLREHKQMAHSKVRFQCEECSYKVHSEAKLKNHCRRVHQSKGYTCIICNSVLKTPGTLTVHMRAHTGETPYHCPTCSKRFTSASKLASHKRMHDYTLRTAECPTCKKKFPDKSKLKIHMSVHTGQKDFKCPSCDYSTYTRFNLKKHCWAHHQMIYPPTVVIPRIRDREAASTSNPTPETMEVLRQTVKDLTDKQVCSQISTTEHQSPSETFIANREHSVPENSCVSMLTVGPVNCQLVAFQPHVVLDVQTGDAVLVEKEVELTHQAGSEQQQQYETEVATNVTSHVQADVIVNSDGSVTANSEWVLQ